MKTYRRVAAAVSILVHALLLLVVGRLILWNPLPMESGDAIVYLELRPPAPLKSIERVPKASIGKQSKARRITKEIVNLPAVTSPEQAVVLRDSLVIDEAKKEEPLNPERQFFGDTLYSILQEHPELKPLVLGQMLVHYVPTRDSLETIREQIADALKPYAEMSDAERAARANMKRFGTARNPYQAPAIPNNIPISDIIRFLIQLLSK